MSGHKVVLMTGAAGGIGAAAVRAFAQAGHAVVAADRDRASLERLEGAELSIEVDVADPGAVAAMVDEARRRFDAFDVVCTNAGVFVGPERPLAETSDEAIDALIAVNLRGVVNVLRATIPHVRDGGAIILTSSISGLQAHPGGVVYAATKTAQLGLARSLAAELSDRRIRVNVIAPGTIVTPMATEAHSPEQLAGFAASNPLGRLGQPADIAQAFVFLAEAAYVNGVVLRVDGGDCLMGAL
jgi:NAD(P)-dependent dehydrogenase (short-subunit alcohol dehydrogenase family)